MTINNSTLEIQSTAFKSWALGCIMACALGKIKPSSNRYAQPSPGDDTNRQHNTAATDGEQRNRYGKDNAWQRSRSICNN